MREGIFIIPFLVCALLHVSGQAFLYMPFLPSTASVLRAAWLLSLCEGVCSSPRWGLVGVGGVGSLDLPLPLGPWILVEAFYSFWWVRQLSLAYGRWLFFLPAYACKFFFSMIEVMVLAYAWMFSTFCLLLHFPREVDSVLGSP